MISRVYLKNCLSFEEVDLEFGKGLNIFTGPSGAGKSILMQELLALFAFDDIKSDLAELSLDKANTLNYEYDINFDDELTIKSIKKDKTRYFLNNQAISKKKLNEFSSSLIKYLSLRDTSDFRSESLINFLDRLSLKTNENFEEIQKEFKEKYKTLIEVKKRLEEIQKDEKNLEDLKEFAKFEIKKIEDISPKIDEYENLTSLKKALAKKEKIEQMSQKVRTFFEYSSNINEFLELLEIDSSFFDESMNELNNILEKANDTISELEDINIEETLTRIEQISSLIKKFGSIEECLEYKDKKIKELETYNSIYIEKEDLENKYKNLNLLVNALASKISDFRKTSAKLLEARINYYLEFLYLSKAKILFVEKNLDSLGSDEIKLELNNVLLNTISAGEYNRLRLALLSAISEFDIGENGILFLDEIDSNLSGKESEAISKVLIKLSENYQIFAISHQIQLSSQANQHFLVDKKNAISRVRILKNNERIEEIARMISGEKVTKEAIEFAQRLIK